MELIGVPPDSRGLLRDLFSGCPGLRGCVAAMLDGGWGTALVDDPEKPEIALLQSPTKALTFFAGEPIRDYVETQLSGFLIVPNEDWAALLRQILGDRLGSGEFFTLEPGRWNREQLQAQALRIPAGFSISRVSHIDIEQLDEFDETFVANHASYSSFLENGIGFCIKQGRQIISACSTGFIGGGKAEIGVRTHQDFRRRGLATALGATMVNHCLERGIEPCWNAGNELSLLYSVAIDTKKHLQGEYAVAGLPYGVLIEPGGTIVYQGFGLDEEIGRNVLSVASGKPYSPL